jgi:hypothetical protein
LLIEGDHHMNQVEKLQELIKRLRAAEITMHANSGYWRGFPLIPNVIAWWHNTTCGGSWYWDNMKRECKGKDFREMWQSCERGDWLLWFAVHLIGKEGWPTHQQIVFASCQCARLALKHIMPGEMRAIRAIERTEAWTRGQSTLEDVRRVGADAHLVGGQGDTAFCAIEAAHSAAWAVYAEEDGCCFRVAQAASGAADWVATADGYKIFTAQLEAHQFGDPARAIRECKKKATLRECANIVRQLLSVPSELP